MTQGFLAVSDLVGLDTGRATELIDSGTVYRLGRSAEISSVPCAVVAESEGTFLIATMSGLIRLTREFHMQRVFRAEWALYYPVSLVVKDRRIAYVGMRGIVVEVDLAAVPAKETWLSPVDLKYPYLK